MNRFIQQLHVIDFCIRKKSVQTTLLFCIALFSFVTIYIFNHLYPIYGDDWAYTLAWNIDEKPIQNFSDILRNQYAHYFTWGGRTIVHVIAQTMLFMDKSYADILNSIAYVVFTLVIYYLANHKKKANAGLLLIINLLIFLFQADYGFTIVCKTSAANYLWGTLIIISFLIPYRNYYYSRQTTNSFSKCFLFLACGIATGWTNENTSAGLIVILFALLVIYKKDGHLPKWCLWGFIGVCIGFIVMVAAPGNFVRGETMSNFQASGGLLDRVYRCLYALSSYSLKLIFILSIGIILYLKFSTNKRNKDLTFIGILFLGAMTADIAMIGAPFFPERATFGLNTFLIISIATCLANCDFKQKTVRFFTYSCIIYGLLFSVKDYYIGYKELANTHYILENRLSKMEKEKSLGKMDFVFTEDFIFSKTRFLTYADFSDDPLFWQNRYFAIIHGVNSVKCEYPK